MNRDQGRRDIRRWVAALFGLAFGVRIVLIGLIPNWQAPDEFAHFYYIKFLATQKKLPYSRPEFPFYESYQPPLYYTLMAMVYAPLRSWDTTQDFPDISQIEGSINPALLVLRLCSVGLGMITLWIVYQFGQAAFGGRGPLALYLLAFVAFLPTFVSNTTSVTNDALANLLGAALLLLCIRPPQKWPEVWMGLLLGLGLLTKPSLGLFFPIIFGAIWLREGTPRKALVFLMRLILIAGAPSLWLYVVNYRRYGSFLALNPGIPSFFPLGHHGWEDLWRVIRNFNWSFWVAFGRIYEVHLPPVAYVVLFLPVTGLAACGVVKLLTAKGHLKVIDDPLRVSFARAFGVSLLAFVLFTGAALYYSLMYPINCAWGKFLFPALPGIALLFVAGLVQACEGALGSRILQGLIALLILLNAYVGYQFILMRMVGQE